MKNLTYQEFIDLAKKNYTKGGMVFVECWADYQYKDYVDFFGPITKTIALKMFKYEHKNNNDMEV
jgi:hypothetical protein